MAEAERRPITVALDTSGELAGVALVEGEALLAEVTWRTKQSHSRELLPALDWLLTRHGRSKDDIEALIVCLGPGSYAGLRVGVSTAKALAFALGKPVLGIDRLAADAYPIVAMASGRVVAVQAAGRAELAWGAYEAGNRAIGQSGKSDELVELIAPRLDPSEALMGVLEAGDVVCAELRTLSEAVVESIRATGARLVEAHASRVVAVAQLGAYRLALGDVDNPDALVPLYLRAPAIGPQR